MSVYTCISAKKLFFFFFFNFFFYFTILYWFGHTSTCICHGCTHVPHPEPPSRLPVHQPQASCILHQTWTGDSILIWYYTCFNAILPNHPPLPLPQSPKDCSIHQCLFCCLAYRVVVNIFLNENGKFLKTHTHVSRRLERYFIHKVRTRCMEKEDK